MYSAEKFMIKISHDNYVGHTRLLKIVITLAMYLIGIAISYMTF